MFPRRLTKAQVEADPNLIWNTFVEIMLEKYADLTPEQRVPHLAFRYDGEVNNGGHELFLETEPMAHWQETSQALEKLGALEQKELLDEAILKVRAKIGDIELSSNEMFDVLLDLDFSLVDCDYYILEPSTADLLEKHLNENLDRYIQIV